MLRFERSRLPEHRETMALVLRVVEILTPVTLAIKGYEPRLPKPEKGGFIQRPGPGLGSPRLWSVEPEPESAVGRAFRILLENDAAKSSS